MTKKRPQISNSWTPEQAKEWATIVRERMEDLGISSNAKLAEQTGFSPLSVGYWMRGARRPAVETIVSIANHLFLDENILLTAAGYKPIAPEDDPERESLHRLVDGLHQDEVSEVISYLMWRRAERQRRARAHGVQADEES